MHHQIQRRTPLASDGVDRGGGEALFAHGAQLLGEGAKVLCAPWNVEHRSQGHRLAGVFNLGPDELVTARIDEVGHALEQGRALRGTFPSPGTVDGSVGGLHGFVDDGRVCFTHLMNQGSGRRVYI